MQQRRPKPKAKSKTGRAKKSRNLTIKAIAEGIGVSTVTIDKYVKRGCPRTSIEAVQKWRSENIKAVAEDADVSEIGIELKRAEMAERWENARTRQMKNDLMNGRLIRKDEYELSLRTGISRLMNRLQSLGTKCANICPAELKVPVKEAVEDTVRIALKELCDDLRTVT
jgi:transcriptional regulator with XRE-family HTH domain